MQLVSQIQLLTGIGYSVSLIVLGNKHDLLNQINLPAERVLILGRSCQNHLNRKGILLGFSSAFNVYRFLKQSRTIKLIAILPMSHWVGRLTVIIGRLTFFGIHLANYHKSQQFKANPPDTFAKKLFHRFNSVLAWNSDKANLFISQSVLNDISRSQFVRRPVIVYNFVNEKKVDESDAREYLQHQGRVFRKLIVIPGRVHPVKGQVFFLEAVKSLLTPQQLKEEEILIVMTGGGPDESAVSDKCIQMDIEGHVLVTGFIEHALLLSFIKLADLVLIPSLFEGLGNVAIEALMLRKPVVSSDAGGLTEIVKDSRCGPTFQAGNPEDLRNTMNRYFENDLQFNMEAGYLWYKAHFTEEIHLERLQRFIEKL